MVDKDFQKLKKQWGLNSKERDEIIEKMRENLLERNSDNEEYFFQYTNPSKVVNIKQTKDVEDLFAVDGDMCPRGL